MAKGWTKFESTVTTIMKHLLNSGSMKAAMDLVIQAGNLADKLPPHIKNFILMTKNLREILDSLNQVRVIVFRFSYFLY